MLEGLEISEVFLSAVASLTNTIRMDAEFYAKTNLVTDRLLNKRLTLRLADITSKIDVGFVGSMTAHYCDVGIPLLQTKNIAPFIVDDVETVLITPEFHSELKKSQIEYEDILIARSGSFGKASIYLKHGEVNSSDIIIIHADKNQVNPYFLTAFLNSGLGANQMIRFASGGVQGHVNLTILEELKIPLLSVGFQTAIENLIQDAHEAIVKSGCGYLSAESLLVESLGLAKFPSNGENVNIKSFNDSFASTGRLDAEYYQPKYENQLRTLRRDGLTIADVAPVRSAKFQKTPGADFQYLEIGGLCGDGSVVSETVACDDAPSRASQRVRKGDIITSTVRPIRRLSALVSSAQDGYVCSSGFVVLQPTKIAAEVLLAYLRLPAICELMDLHTSASLYPAISERDLLGLPIPAIPEAKQRKITALVQQSFTLKIQSERLLEAAKRSVEIAIEQDEAAGMAYLARENSTE